MAEIAATTRPRYIDVAEVAKMLRPVLKRTFPGVKFSVRIDRFSMGSSIDISWTDGPTDEQVGKVTGGFQGGRFEGMTDCAYSADSWHCKTHGARSAETYGCDLADNNGPTHSRCCAHAELVHFSATFVHTRRDLSPEFRAELLIKVCGESNLPIWSTEDTALPPNSTYNYGDYGDTVRDAIYRLSVKTPR